MKKNFVVTEVVELPAYVSPEVWKTVPWDERCIFQTVVRYANHRPVCAWLRSDKPMRRELRSLIADLLEGKYKRPRHRPRAHHPLAVAIDHDSNRAELKYELEEIAAELRAKRLPSPVERAKALLCERRGLTDRQLKRALEPLRPPKTKS